MALRRRSRETNIAGVNGNISRSAGSLPEPRRLTRGRALVAVVLMVGCSQASVRSAGEGDGSCALGVRLDGRAYYANGGVRIIPTYGEPLGRAVVPPCDGEDGFEIEALTIRGVDPAIAFASPAYEESIFITEGVYELPAELRRLRRPPRCVHGTTPVELTGQWLGILDPGVDLVPPYRLQMRVDLATLPRYERTFLTVRVDPDLGRPLSREDLRSSLWKGGSLSAMVSCTNRTFVAEEVTALPGT